LLKAGFSPEGVFQNLNRSPDQNGKQLLPIQDQSSNPFTGSERAGNSPSGKIAGRHLKKSAIELGGSNALSFLKDADIDQGGKKTAVRTPDAARWPKLIAAKRFFLVESI